MSPLLINKQNNLSDIKQKYQSVSKCEFLKFPKNFFWLLKLF